jgi:pimeloyl-ACP methyl ester carboxylesterase
MRIGVRTVAICLLATLLSFVSALEDSNIEEWHISVPQEKLDDLRRRLENAILPQQLEDVQDWSYGTPLAFVKEMRRYWLEQYDWRAREKRLNDMFQTQYVTKINGRQVHFVHVKSANETAVPLIVSHGWPGSVLECSKLIPLLTQHFHIVCPSIPGFFFSDPPTKRGFDTQQTAETFKLLMARLNYTNYLAQGGDWGSEVSRWLGIIDPQCIGVHINMVIAQAPIVHNSLFGLVSSFKTALQLIFPTWFFDEQEIEHLERLKQYGFLESAYLLYHSTKPETLSFAFSDSPLGLASYLWEKYHSWADLSGDDARLTEVFSKDELIDFVMAYWISDCFASSLRIYKETIPKLISEPLPYQPKPTAIAAFKDIVVMPKEWASHGHNIVRWNNMPHGGHFAALEVPELLSKDIIDFSFALSDFFRGIRSPVEPPKNEPMGFGDL